MLCTFLYPADYFDPRQVEPDFAGEYESVRQFPDFAARLLDYDALIARPGPPPRLPDMRPGLCIYRGWMLPPERYRALYRALAGRDVRLVNSPEEYEACHLFPNIYPLIAAHTPKTLFFPDGQEIDWHAVNRTFRRFLIKDYVKSVKGADFPQSFATPVDAAAMRPVLERFRELRGSLFTGGYVFKECITLRRYSGKTNEYRAFFLHGDLVSLHANSCQGQDIPAPPMDYVMRFAGLPSRFYTVDFAQVPDGWTVIETGDGQVSGLSPGQLCLSFYARFNQSLQARNTDIS